MQLTKLREMMAALFSNEPCCR